MKRRVFILVAALVMLSAFVAVAAPKFRIAVSLPPANNAWQAKMLDSVNAEVAKDTANCCAFPPSALTCVSRTPIPPAASNFMSPGTIAGGPLRTA